MIERIGSKRFIVFCLAAIAFLSLSLRLDAQNSASDVITNVRVVEMTKLGLDDDVIVAKIKTGRCSFQTQDQDLVELKNSGVSPKVIAAMLVAGVITTTRVTIDKKPIELHTLGQEKTGGRVGNYFTYGLKSVKIKAFLSGQHSSAIVSPNPVIEIELPKDETIDNYIVVQLDGKSDRRELEVASVGAIVGQKQGVRAEAIRKTSVSPQGNNKFKLNVHEPLKPGEYIVYVVGSIDHVKGIYGRGYDFTVE